MSKNHYPSVILPIFLISNKQFQVSSTQTNSPNQSCLRRLDDDPSP